MLDDTDRWMCTVQCAGTISRIRPPTLVNTGGGEMLVEEKQVMEVEVVEVIEVFKVEVE